MTIVSLEVTATEFNETGTPLLVTPADLAVAFCLDEFELRMGCF